MLKLNNLPFFVAAVEQGGFAAAARVLGLPKSTISKRVAELEEELSVRLIHRTSRSFRLTDLGQEFFDRARAVLIEAEAAEQIVRSRQSEPSGIVRVTSSVPTAQIYLAPLLPDLALLYPRLNLQLEVSDRFVDVVQEGFDIAVRSHFQPLPDSDLVQRTVLTEPMILVAAPGYLRDKLALLQPEDLAHHDGLLTGPGKSVWQLHRQNGGHCEVSPIPRMVANESQVLINAAMAGLGVTCLPAGMCQDALLNNQLVQVLPEWNGGMVTTTLLMPHRRGQLPGVRAAVEFIIKCMSVKNQ